MAAPAAAVGAAAAAALPTPRFAPSPPAQVDLVEARQLAHVAGLDTAYHEGYTVMREAAGQDLSAPNLLADSYATYLAARRALLAAAAGEQAERVAETSKFTPRNRFLLGSAQATDLTAPVGACAPLGGPAAAQQGAMAGSYVAWRRALLAHRFEKRRAGLTEELVKRLAAEAMQRALAAESAERDAHDYATKAAGDARAAALRGEPLVWRCVQHYASALADEDEVVLSLHLGGRSPTKRTRGALPNGGGAWGSTTTAAAAGRPLLGATTAGAGAYGFGATGGGASAGLPPPHPDTSGGGAGVALPGGRTITALAFAPKGNDCFAVATAAGVVYLCSASTGEKWATLVGHTAPIVAMDWSPPEARELSLLTVSEDRTARIWAVALPKVVAPPAAVKTAVGVADGKGRPQLADATASVGAAGGGGTQGSAGSAPLPSPTSSSPAPTAGSAAAAAVDGGASTPPRRASSTSLTPSRGRRSGFTPRAGGTPGRGGGGGSLPPLGASDRAAELERAKARMREEAEAARRRAEAAAGPRLVGGGAHCARIVQLEGALEVASSYYATSAASGAAGAGSGVSTITHAAWCPTLPHMMVLAVAEEGVDPRLEAALAAAAEADAAASRRGSTATGGDLDSLADAADRYGDDDVTGSGSGGGSGINPLNKFGRGMVGAMKQAGKATMGVLEGGVGGAAKFTAALTKAVGGGDFVTAGGAGGAGGGGGGSGGGAAGASSSSSSAPARERRGAIMIVDARTGRVVQTRQVKGSKIAITLPGVAGIARGAAAPLLLQQSVSHATALAFSASGQQLYVADGRGLVHEYAIEADPADAQAKPLKAHAVIFGEGANTFVPMGPGSGSSAEEAFAGLTGGGGGGGFGGAFGFTGSAAAPPPPQPSASASQPPPYLTSLFFRPYDAALRGPVLIGMDSRRHARALLLPLQTSSNTDYRPPPSASEGGRVAAGAAAMRVASAAKAGARMAVGAMEVVAKGAAAAAVVSAAAATGMNLNINVGSLGLKDTPQALEVEFLSYVAATTQASAGGTGLPPFGATGGLASSSYGGAGFTGFSAFGATGGAAAAAAAGAPHHGANAPLPPTAHTAMLPCRLNDGLLVGTAGGDVIVTDPHTHAHHDAAAANSRTIGRAVGLGGLAVGGAAREPVPASVSGVVPAQVVARLAGASAAAADGAPLGATGSSSVGGGGTGIAFGPSTAPAPITFLALNRDESTLITADAAGSVSAWRKVPLSMAEAAEAAAAPARGLLSPVGIVTSARLAALFEAHGHARSLGRVAAEEARALALGHLGGGSGSSSTLGPGGGAPAGGGGGGGSVSGRSLGAGGASSRRALPTAWTAAPGSTAAAPASGPSSRLPAHPPLVR